MSAAREERERHVTLDATTATPDDIARLADPYPGWTSARLSAARDALRELSESLTPAGIVRATEKENA